MQDATTENFESEGARVIKNRFSYREPREEKILGG